MGGEDIHVRSHAIDESGHEVVGQSGIISQLHGGKFYGRINRLDRRYYGVVELGVLR